jgi:hypothetical protein
MDDPSGSPSSPMLLFVALKNNLDRGLMAAMPFARVGPTGDDIFV